MQKANDIFENSRHYGEIYKQITAGGFGDGALPGNAWFTGGNEIFTLPSDECDCRYPYGGDGFNFWAYTSGYMHANEGRFTLLMRSMEGEDPVIACFAGFDGPNGREVFPILAVPDLRDGGERATIFSPGHVTYMAACRDVRFLFRVFVTDDRKVNFTLTAENEGEKEVSFDLSSYLDAFLLHSAYKSGEDRWFREATVKEDGVLPAFVLRCNESISRTVQLRNFGVVKSSLSLSGGARMNGHEETTSRNNYTGGVRSGLHHAKSLKEGTFGDAPKVTTFTETAVFGDMLHITLPAGGRLRKDSQLSFALHCGDEKPLEELLLSAVDGKEIDDKLAALEKEQKAQQQGIQFSVNGGESGRLTPRRLNSFFNVLKKQVEFCALLKGYAQTGAGSLIGVRDVSQAIEGYLIWQPKKAREKLLEVLSFTDPSGRCPRQYSLPAFPGDMPAMDLRQFIDQGVWVISTIVSYLKFTDDFAFLNEECGYCEIVDEKGRIVRESDERDSVLDHLIRIMNWLISKTDIETGCTRVLYGDWNDALDGLGVSGTPGEEFGSGVSVMAAAQVYRNLNEMAQLLSRVNSERYGEMAERYLSQAKTLCDGLYKYGIVRNEKGERRITHGWGDKRSYYVGSFNDSDGRGRVSVTANAFFVLCGLTEVDGSLYSDIERDFALLDSPYGLKTFEPGFEPDMPGVGRIPKLPMGTAENGAAYVHASAFGIMALFEMGRAQKAWEQLQKIVPVTHQTISVSPFVMPNSYGYNPGKNINGQSMTDWQTGSSNVVLKMLVRYVMGVRPEYDGVWICPAEWCPYSSFSAQVTVCGVTLSIIYENKGIGERSFTLNGGLPSKAGTQGLWIPKEVFTSDCEVRIET